MVPSPGLRIRALLALVVFSISLALPLLSFGHYTLDDDRACGSVELTASHPARFEAPPPTPKTHCAVCHFLRAVGGSRTSAIATVHAWLEPAPIAVSEPSTSFSAPAFSLLPSRAPPVTLG